MYKFAEPILNLEEDVRFELTDPFEPSVFKTDAIGRSANLPLFFIYSIQNSEQDLHLCPQPTTAYSPTKLSPYRNTLPMSGAPDYPRNVYLE